MSLKPTVAVADTFLEAAFSLPKDVQKRALKFMRDFRANPESSGINYETIKGASDKNLRSCRVDGSYRAIVLKPDSGAVYIALFVANHDDAYDWACRKRVAIHPDTGTLQVLPIDMGTLVEPSEVVTKGLFDNIRDRELRTFGLPEEFLPEVRACLTMADFERLEKRLPLEAYEALFWLADGESVEDVWRALMRDPAVEEQVDTDDVATALKRAGTQRHFKVIEEVQEVDEVFLLERWRVFLHPVQNKVAYAERSGSTRVLGGAGTGKTVVAMHRAKHLAQTLCTQPNDRILLTTFTKNLATDIRKNLELLCGVELVKERIEVINLDAWVSRFLAKNQYEFEVAYFGLDDKLRTIWNNVLSVHAGSDFEPSFWREEWERVVQSQGITTLRDYLKASRAGRGVSLHRAKRMEVWKVFEAYRGELDRQNIREAPDAMRDAMALLKERPELVSYKAIIVDEGQDFGNAAFELLRAMVPVGPNDLFIVGDAHQRIYKQKVTLSRCGIRVVGRSFRLRINYRTTDEIRRFALALLHDVEVDDLDEGKDSSKGYMSHRHGPAPEVACFKTFDQEMDAIADFIGNDSEKWRTVCVTAPQRKLTKALAEGLEARGIATHILQSMQSDDAENDGVRVATMHRVKGLEFDRVVVACASEGMLPRRVQTDDVTVLEDNENGERSLVYVALTRARSEALVTAHGRLSPFFQSN
ncbi:MAG: AAA family ATPase [bacterium]